MKTRLDNLEAKTASDDPIQELRKIYKRFAAAFFIIDDIKLALQIRHEAEPILKRYPDLKENVPITIGKAAYIDWQRFIDFPTTKNMDP